VASSVPCGLFVSAHAAAIASQLIADSPADGDSGGVQLWNVADRQPLGSRHQIAASLTSGMEFTRVMAVQFSPDGTMLAIGMNDGTEQLRDVPTQQAIGAPLANPGPNMHQACHIEKSAHDN
jgi:WD40 repeat protein